MMEVTGSLEEQLEATKDKAIEVRAKKTNLTKIEGIGGVMEEKLILDNRWEINYPPTGWKYIQKMMYRPGSALLNSWNQVIKDFLI